MKSYFVRYWAIGPGTLIGGVRESKSSRYGDLAEAQDYRDSVVALNGGPDRCGSEIIESTERPEIYRHCAGYPSQAVGSRCFGCGQIVP